MRYRVITQPAAEPVSLEAAKLHLHEDGTAEDERITDLIKAAREYCEGITRRALALQTIEAYPKWFEDQLPRPPLREVVAVSYKDAGANTYIMAEGTDFLVDTLDERLVTPPGKSWKSFDPYPIKPITVQYKAGYDDEMPMPNTIRQAMLLLIGHWFANRETVTVGTVSEKLKLATDDLLIMHRARW